MDWIDANPQDLLDDVLEAKVLTGEDIDEDSPSVRQRVLVEIQRAQRDVRDMIQMTDEGQVLVYRAMNLSSNQIDRMSVSDGLGECWAFDRRGAFPYNGRPGGSEPVIFTGKVDPNDISGPFVLAMWEGGEVEARLMAQAEIEIVEIEQGGRRIREDLTGERLGVQPLVATSRDSAFKP